MENINIDKMMKLINAMGPTIGSNDRTQYWQINNRSDVVVAQRTVTLTEGAKRSVWYVGYNNGSGTRIEKLHDTGNIYENCCTWTVTIEEGAIVVKTSKGIFSKNLSSFGLITILY